jgi:hypothetical protein
VLYSSDISSFVQFVLGPGEFMGTSRTVLSDRVEVEEERAMRMTVKADVRIEAIKMRDLVASIDLGGCGGINGDLRVVNSS